MDYLWLLARLILITLLGVAGIAKLADRNGSRQAMISFGVPSMLAKPFGVILPLLEITFALALIPATTAWWGAFGALGLMLLFIIGIGINLARGRKPDCHCFGQLYSAPAGWPALLRNAFFAVISGLIVWGSWNNITPSFLSLLSFTNTAELLGFSGVIIVLTLFAVEGWFLFHLLKQNGRLLVRIEALERAFAAEGFIQDFSQQPPLLGLPIGAEAPAFYLIDLDGKKFSLEDFLSDVRPLMLIFSNPDCGPCNALMPEIAQWQRDYADLINIILILQGSVNINRAKVSQYKLTNVLMQNGHEVAESYGAIRTPSAVMVHPDGTIGSKQVLGADQIRDLVAEIISLSNQPVLAPEPVVFNASNNSHHGHDVLQAQPSRGILKIGELAPSFSLPTLNGEMIELIDFQGSACFLLFWNPGCVFCIRMLDDLKAWEARRPQGAPKLLILSTGTVNENRSMGLQSLVVIDTDFRIGTAIGITGTPSGVLLDENGKISSEVAIGAPAIFAHLHSESIRIQLVAN